MTEKRFNVFDVDGTVFLEDHIEGSYHIGEKENVDIPCLNDIADRLNTYADENEQLKQRNDRQYNQLKQLWELIEDEDYNTLRSMLNQREADEKLLQKEWGTYSD